MSSGYDRKRGMYQPQIVNVAWVTHITKTSEIVMLTIKYRIPLFFLHIHTYTLVVRYYSFHFFDFNKSKCMHMSPTSCKCTRWPTVWVFNHSSYIFFCIPSILNDYAVQTKEKPWVDCKSRVTRFLFFIILE